MLSSKCKLVMVTKCSQRREKFKIRTKKIFPACFEKKCYFSEWDFFTFFDTKTDSREKLSIFSQIFLEIFPSFKNAARTCQLAFLLLLVYFQINKKTCFRNIPQYGQFSSTEIKSHHLHRTSTIGVLDTGKRVCDAP
jgi:hypothetical protein